WFLGRSGIHPGSRFGRYGIEVDARTSDSPAGTTVLARIPNIFGRGRTAEMTYYRTLRGAKVFAAGAMNFGGSADWPVVSRLLRNVWTRIASPSRLQDGGREGKGPPHQRFLEETAVRERVDEDDEEDRAR